MFFFSSAFSSVHNEKDWRDDRVGRSHCLNKERARIVQVAHMQLHWALYNSVLKVALVLNKCPFSSVNAAKQSAVALACAQLNDFSECHTPSPIRRCHTSTSDVVQLTALAANFRWHFDYWGKKRIALEVWMLNISHCQRWARIEWRAVYQLQNCMR